MSKSICLLNNQNYLLGNCQAFTFFSSIGEKLIQNEQKLAALTKLMALMSKLSRTTLKNHHATY